MYCIPIRIAIIAEALTVPAPIQANTGFGRRLPASDKIKNPISGSAGINANN